MINYILLLVCGLGNIGSYPSDTLIKWSEGIRLNYSDFSGKRTSTPNPGAAMDTTAVIDCYIKYDIQIENGKHTIHAYAVANPQKSWMVVYDPEVLKHEQGHFDITEIFARRFQKILNDTTIHGLHDYFSFLTTTYNEVRNELIQEHGKYDVWTMNAPGKEYYSKWISEQLAASKKNE